MNMNTHSKQKGNNAHQEYHRKKSHAVHFKGGYSTVGNHVI